MSMLTSFLPENDVFARLNYALGTSESVCAWEASVGLVSATISAGLVRPLGRERGLRLVFVHRLDRVEYSAGHQSKALLKVFYAAHPVLLSSRLR